MTSKSSSRKSRAKEIKSDEMTYLSEFTLPLSLACPEIDFPVLIPDNNKTSWAVILEESGRKAEEIKEYIESKNPQEPKAPFLKTEGDFIKYEGFPYLIPALEETLNKAQLWDALKTQKCFFDGIDHIAEVLWNNNPRHPSRKMSDLHIFNMPWARKLLKETPRPYYPKSWLWTEEFAATMIQKTVRRYFVLRDPNVQEMRTFWKKLAIERTYKPEITTNPLFSKRFASECVISKK